jgi:hypothetical protein
MGTEPADPLGDTDTGTAPSVGDAKLMNNARVKSAMELQEEAHMRAYNSAQKRNFFKTDAARDYNGSIFTRSKPDPVKPGAFNGEAVGTNEVSGTVGGERLISVKRATPRPLLTPTQSAGAAGGTRFAVSTGIRFAAYRLATGALTYLAAAEPLGWVFIAADFVSGGAVSEPLPSVTLWEKDYERRRTGVENHVWENRERLVQGWNEYNNR